jgi:hypothetical protein
MLGLSLETRLGGAVAANDGAGGLACGFGETPPAAAE